jgi:hypothetical protein
MSHPLIFVLIISFIASLVRSTFGFGESLIGVPFFILFLPVGIAVPLSVLLSVFIALVVIIQDHSKVHFKSAKWLIIYAVPGIPVGILLLVYGSELLVKTGLGILIIFYSLYSLFAKARRKLKEDNMWWLFICGFLSGIFGGAYGLNGPPLVVYGNMRQWSAKHFRATLQAYFLPASLIAVAGYYSKGLMNAEVIHYFLISLTTSVPAIFLGRYLNQRLKNGSFFKYIYYALLVLGLILILNAFTA